MIDIDGRSPCWMISRLCFLYVFFRLLNNHFNMVYLFVAVVSLSYPVVASKNNGDYYAYHDTFYNFVHVRIL